MPKKSEKRSSSKIPNFETEAEEAEFWSSQEGRRRTSREFQKAVRKGIIVNEDPSREAVEAAQAKAHRSGKAVLHRNGISVKRTDPAALQKLYDDAVAKITQPVSLRIPVADLDLAKAIAKKQGVGYQAVLKSLIHEGVRKAS